MDAHSEEDPVIDLKPACAEMALLLSAVTDERLADPTPCAGYTVGGLIAHIDEVARPFAPAGSADGDGENGSRADVIAHVHALGDAWDDPAAWRGTTAAAGVELPNEVWGKIALTELVVHGWDLAQAIGRPFDLPEDTLRACLDHVTRFVPNAPIPELWGPPVPVPTTASTLQKIIATTGRTP